MSAQEMGAADAELYAPTWNADTPWRFFRGMVWNQMSDPDTDCEVFGPLVQLCVVGNLDEAIEQANATHFGLAASIFTTDDGSYDRFFASSRAGCINRNAGTAGASSKLPFGGHGLSGNHRPAAAFSVDYCVYPVANMVEQSADVAVPAGMAWDDSWI